MATQRDHRILTDGLTFDDDCPLCGASWGMCHGLCAAHESMSGREGPFHSDFNDDCDLCNQEEEWSRPDQIQKNL